MSVCLQPMFGAVQVSCLCVRWLMRDFKLAEPIGDKCVSKKGRKNVSLVRCSDFLFLVKLNKLNKQNITGKPREPYI